MAVDLQTGFNLFNAIAAAGRTIYEIAEGTAKLETKQQLMKVYDTLMALKRDAAAMEDMNRDLREKLRFKIGDFEFRNPFWYNKTDAGQPLCAKCFAREVAAPMSLPYRSGGLYRRCLVCGNIIELEPAPEYPLPVHSPWS